MLCYLDNAATTPVRQEAIDAMLPTYTDVFGNPSGAHSMARQSLRLVDDARESLAEALSVSPGEVIFTSGGTEADNMAINGSHRALGGLPACSAIEHHAVLHPVEALGGTIIGVSHQGRSNLAQIADLPADTCVVSVMAANNETGIVQPLEEVAAAVREHVPNALLHVDAVQGFCWLDMPSITSLADMVSLSAHKFGGPKGVGALVLNKGHKISPTQLGGSQERDRRAGTHNVAGIVGMAAAATATLDHKDEAIGRVSALRDELVDGIRNQVSGVHIAGGTDIERLPNIAHLCFEAVESEALLFLLEREEIMASAASSCASGAMEPSHVLAAMGVERDLALGSVRLSLGYQTTGAEIEHVLTKLPAAVEQIRSAKR